MSLDFSSKVSILAGCNHNIRLSWHQIPHHNPCQQRSKLSPWSGMTPTSARLTAKIFQALIFFLSKTGLSTPMPRPAALMVKWVAKAGLLCEVLLSPLYNHLYYQIKYKMTAHNKVVTADTVSWPLPIITWDISKRITDKSSVLFCHQSYSVWSMEWCVFSFSGCHHQYFVSPEARDVGEEAGGGGLVMTKSHPWHSPSHSWHPTHSSNPPGLHTPLLRHQICIG